jgi:hypothetical protein
LVRWQCDVCPGLSGGCPGVEVHVAAQHDDELLARRDVDIEIDVTSGDDNVLPRAPARAPARSRIRVAANVALVASGLALAGGAAYGVVPGELGDHGAKLVNAPGPAAESPTQTLSEAYAPSHQLAGGDFATLGSTTDPHIVYVDGDTPSAGPAIISAAFPTATESVLATRSNDGSCSYLRGDGHTIEVATVRAGSPCQADKPPAKGWRRYIAR